MLHKTQRDARGKVARYANALSATQPYPRAMDGNQPPRRHFIPEWAERRHMNQADLLRALSRLEGEPADKSTVSRWWAGSMPNRKHLKMLQGVFALEDFRDLFRHPDDDWMARFFKRMSEEERVRAKVILEQTFPHLKAG